MCSVQCVLNGIYLLLLGVTSPTATVNAALSGRQIDTSAPVSYTVTRVPALVGGKAELPCPVTTTMKNDRLMLVVWYIGLEPVYSYDSEQPASKAHWVEESYAGRTRWLTSPTGRLQLTEVQAQDRGEYRCRVDYYKSPTANYRIALDVVELPKKPVIYDSRGKEVIDVAGPYHEGDELRLICTVTGGYPSPRIQWLHGDVVLNSLSASQYHGPSRSLTLVITNATRAHMNALYTCSADNTLLAPQQKTTVKLELYLKPLTVEIISRELPLSVGRKSQLTCKTTGARPPAKITWWLEGKQMDAILMESEFGSNMTESLLVWTPTKQHNGKTVSCRAHHVNDYSIETTLTLNVYYMPESKIYLGAQINAHDIEDGDDVYFVCEVDANPPAYKVVWEHNGIQLQHNPANNVIVTGSTSMALRHVSREQAGRYTCTASNVEGDGTSPPLFIQVIYKPVCQTKETKIRSAQQELTTIECKVDAYPPPEHFEWILNGSWGSIKVDPVRYTTEMKEGKSVLVYTPMSEADYGTLACRARNLAGQQVAPCLYILLPVTKPDPPTNCTAYNLTDNSLDLFCIPGYDGGRQCVYVAEVWSKGRLVLNESSDTALWKLKPLGRTRKFKIKVYAANERGRSDHFYLNIETTLKLPPRKETDIWNVDWAVVITLIAALIVGFISCAVVVMKTRHGATDYEVPLPSLINHSSMAQKQDSPLSTADKHTDLVLLSNVAEPAPDPPAYVACTALRNTCTTHNFHRIQTPMIQIPSRVHYDIENDIGRNVNNAMRLPREIVTTKTPLLSADRESCV